MSAIHPFPGNTARKAPADDGVSERERALESEVQALRAELAQLRQVAAPSQVHEHPPADPYSALFAALGSVFPIGMFRVQPDGTLLHVDPMMEQMFGLTAEGFENFGWMCRVHPDDLGLVRARWEHGVARGESTSLEFRIQRPDEDGVTHVVARNIPQFDEHGRLIGQLGFVQDISQLRKLESEARIKDELNRQIIASSPDCTKVLDLEGHVLQMTDQGCKLVEVDDFEQVRGSDWTQWWPADGQQRAREALQQATRTGHARFVAFGNTFKGTPKWWDTVVSPITSGDGRPVMLLAVTRDITESHQQQEQIRQLNAELEVRVQARTAELASLNERLQQTLDDARALYHRAPCGYHSVDATGIFVLINRTELDWLGATEDEVVGKMHFRDFVLPEFVDLVKDRLQRLIRGEKLEAAEIGMRRRDGSSFVALLSSTAVFDDDGHFVRTNNTLVDITDRKASEDQVRQANRQLAEALALAQSLYNEAPCGYHSVDAQGIYVNMNETELRWLGYTREEVIGKMRYSDFTAPGRSKLVEERHERLQQEGMLEPVEYELRRRDGSTIDVLMSSAAVRDEQGRYLRSNTTVMDISARKAAETALRENQRFLHTVTNHVPGLIAYLDAMLRFRFANDEHKRLYGIDPTRAMGLHISECLSAEIWGEIQPSLQGALDGQTRYHEAWRTAADGSRVYVRATFLPDIIDGLVQGVIVQIIDITERKRIEERVNQLNDELELRIRERSNELLESEQRFRLMVDNLRDYSVFFLDAQGHVTDWPDSAQRMEGYAPSEVIGQHYSTLLQLDNPDDAPQIAHQMLRMAASRGQHELHTWQSRKDGSRYWSHSILIALRDDSGELRGFSKISRDMTDAKRLDDLMRNINDELENRVADRTEQLLAANKDLESFSYSVSHDLRSPLRHISSFVSLLEEHLGAQGDETTRRYLGTIGNSARHMSQLIDGLLAFSRLGRAAVNVMPVDFAMLVEAVVSQIAHDTEGRVVDWVIAPDLPVVQGDALLLREVWANLLGNAFKYSRPRERARIEVGWSVDPAVGYTFYVKDNGVGFDTKYAQKLFGVFQRLHRASEFEGTGIGLALTRRILERHGGSIWAESQQGEGSTFHFSLPFEGCSPSDATPDSIPSVLEP
jgi:PAS domain S-box-containing protein